MVRLPSPAPVPRPTRPLFLDRLGVPGRPRVAHRPRIFELRRGDTATVQEIFRGMSAHSRFLRFHTGLPALPLRTLRRLADTDPGRHVAHVAMIGRRPVGLVRWIRYPDRGRTAELALEVVDDAQGRGIGRALVAAAARSAQQAGVEDFLAYVMPGNRAALSWARSRGAVTDPADDSVLRLPVASLLPAPTKGARAR